MAYKDLREFLAACKEAGDLIEVNRPISTDLEIGKALKRVMWKTARLLSSTTSLTKVFLQLVVCLGTGPKPFVLLRLPMMMYMKSLFKV